MPPTKLKKPSLQLDVHRQSLDAQAADSLREAVLTGQLQPGERITEEIVAESLGLSRGTIRASLRKLAHEGLIVQEPYKGYSVRSLSSRDAWELFTLRHALEAFAARMLAEQMNEEKRRRLDKAYDQVIAAVNSGSRSKAVAADFELHRTIVELTGHSTLLAHYMQIASQVRLYQTLVSKFLSLQDYVKFHQPLIDALRAGRAADAERISAEHNTADGERLVDWLRQDEERRQKLADAS